MAMSKQIREKVKTWEYSNILGNGYVYKYSRDNSSLRSIMETKGYDAMRISPRESVINGLKYRKVFGATIEPNYTIKQEKGKYYPKVEWHEQGFIKSGKRKGTTDFKTQGSMYIPSALKSQLMM